MVYPSSGTVPWSGRSSPEEYRRPPLGSLITKFPEDEAIDKPRPEGSYREFPGCVRFEVQRSWDRRAGPGRDWWRRSPVGRGAPGPPVIRDQLQSLQDRTCAIPRKIPGVIGARPGGVDQRVIAKVATAMTVPAVATKAGIHRLKPRVHGVIRTKPRAIFIALPFES